ncbi:MAG: serine/threonine-protein kinase, partial [Anaerolineae bacterium]|nr:serine/threonine-protein kinase [Anaerolineae bacterium]
MDLIGRTLGLYEIVDVLATGPVATIYKGYRSTVDLHVAIKVLSEDASKDDEFVERFQRGARLAAVLKHPNIIRIYEIGEEHGLPYVAMDYVAGSSLAARLEKEGPLSVEEAVAIAAQVGSALDYAHAEGVVHGNLTPSNVLLAPDGRVILTDFRPTAEAATGQGEAEARRSAVTRFAAPEQAQGEAPDASSDLYSLGAILCEMLAGPGSFAGPLLQDTPGKAGKKQPSASPVPEAGIPPRLRGVLSRAVHSRRAKRYRRGYELALALARAGGLGDAAARKHLHVAVPRGWTAPRQRAPQPSYRRIVLAALAVLALAAVALVLLSGGGGFAPR